MSFTYSVTIMGLSLSLLSMSGRGEAGDATGLQAAASSLRVCRRELMLWAVVSRAAFAAVWERVRGTTRAAAADAGTLRGAGTAASTLTLVGLVAMGRAARGLSPAAASTCADPQDIPKNTVSISHMHGRSEQSR